MRPYGYSATLLLLVLSMACGEKDSSAPTDPGTGSGLVLLLDAQDPNQWDCQGIGSNNCSYCTVGAGTITIRDSTYLNPDSHRCNSLGGRCKITSVGRIDFRPYTSARLKCRIERVGAPFTAGVSIWIRSNVPGTPDLEVYSTGAAQPEDIDISLVNALGYSEATVEVSGTAYASGEPNQGCGDTAGVMITRLRIVGAP